MKEIINWSVSFKNNGEKGIGILLPGCIVSGVLICERLQVDIEVNVVDVDMGNMVITASNGEKYKLLAVNKEYVQNLNKCIEIGRKEMEEMKDDYER